jgi:hypothetical protein
VKVWAGDNRVAGAFGIAAGLLSAHEAKRLLQIRRDETRTALQGMSLTPETPKIRPLTGALVVALVSLIVGLVAADAGVGVILGLAGFAAGWLSLLSIEKRRHRKS